VSGFSLISRSSTRRARACRRWASSVLGLAIPAMYRTFHDPKRCTIRRSKVSWSMRDAIGMNGVMSETVLPSRSGLLAKRTTGVTPALWRSWVM
jgi:hypothetical protein